MSQATDSCFPICSVAIRLRWRFFFRRYSPYLFAVALRYIPDHDDARDLLQDSLIKIFTSVKGLRIDPRLDDRLTERSLKAWSSRIVVNMALNHLRDSARLVKIPLDENPRDDIPDEDVDADTLSVEEIMSLISELPPNYRTVFNLFAIEKFSHREISHMLGISESVSATQYHRARAALKKKIIQYIANK